MTDTKKKIIHIVSIILMLVLIILPLKNLAILFSNDGTFKRMDSLYAQPKGSVDVLCVGSSRVYCNIAPDVMWREYGISAYNLATSAQPLNLTYYALKEALKYQNPKVVVVEASTVLAKDQPNDQLETMGVQTGMKYSVNQVEALLDHKDKDHFMEYLLRFPCFHNNYTELTKESFDITKYYQFPNTKAAGFKGYIHEGFYYSPVAFLRDEGYTEDPYSEERYDALVKINDLCKEKGTQLLLVLTPSCEITEYESVCRFSSEYGIPYINYMKLIDEIGLSGEGDMIDNVHCSYYGAAKVSRYLSEFLIGNMGITSHAGDPAYESWDEYATYLALIENNKLLEKETGLGNYFNYIPNPNYLIITSLRGNYDTRDVGQRSVLAKLGCNDVAYAAGGCWVLDGSELKFYYTPSDGECEWSEELYGSDFRISNNNEDEEDHSVKVYINGEEIIINDEAGIEMKDGIEFLVYDKLSQEVVDAAIFDSINDYRIVRNIEEN